MVDLICMYVIVSSATLIYGIGTKKLFVISEKPKHIFALFLKSSMTIAGASSLSWVVADILLASCQKVALFPFFAILFTLFFSIILQRFIFATFKIDTAEFGFSFLTVILAVNEASFYTEAMIIGFVCCASYYILIPIIAAIRSRIKIVSLHPDVTVGSLVLLSAVLIIFAMYSWNVSWLNLGVYK